MKMTTPFKIYGLSNNTKTDSRVSTHDARTAYEKVLDYAGASLSRDSYDTRIIHEARTGTATFKGASTSKPGIIDKVTDTQPAGAGDDWSPWPALASGNVPDYTSAGLPAGWLESLYPGKQATDLNEEGYTYLEVYLNSLVETITNNQSAGALTSIAPVETSRNPVLAVTYQAAGNQLTVSAEETIDSVLIYNLTGQLITAKTGKANHVSLEITPNQGRFLIVKAVMAGSPARTTKLII
jgi:hypothetical protein